MKTIKQVIGIDVSKDTFHVCFGSIDEAQCIKVLNNTQREGNACVLFFEIQKQEI